MTPGTKKPDISGLRVAHVVATDAFAGSERYAANLAIGLSRAGAEVTLIGGDPGPMRSALAEVGEDVVHLPASGLTSSWARLRRLGKRDIVHAHLTTAEVAAVLAFPTRSHTVLVSTRHIAARRGSSMLGQIAAPAVRARLDGQLAPSTYVAERIDGPCVVVPTGVADADQGTHDQPVVIVVQRLEAEKDTTTALRAWAASGLAGRGWEMLVAGTGSEGEALHELALELGIEGSCNFVGRVEDVPQRLARSGLMLATATCDSFGLAVVEAMACGLPVVAAAAGGHLETIGPVAGAALFPARDYIAAAALLRRLAEDGSDRAAYGAQLRERQRHEYSLSAFVDRVAAWYLDVLGPRNSRSSQDRAVAGQLGLP